MDPACQNISWFLRAVDPRGRCMKGKTVIVGVTGGIAAYKAAELVRLLVREEVSTSVAMTANATRFVTPLTFQALSGNRVIWDMWGIKGSTMDHISWGQTADLIIIAPATANMVAKLTHGLADDFLSTMVLAATAKVLICPAMNTQMYTKAVVQENLRILSERGYEVMCPGEGQLACGAEGMGRMPEPAEIVERAAYLLAPKDLSGMRILVTAGPTVEPIDPVRYISNRSSGKMGYALAERASKRGAAVILVSGPTHLKPPYGVRFSPVKTAEEMKNAVVGSRSLWDVAIKAAAVADYRPAETADQKIKKTAAELTLKLVRNPDILAALGASRGEEGCILVGFAAETADLLSNAREKLASKHLDMIVANDVARSDAGFDVDTNIVKIIDREGSVEDLPLKSKTDVADRILDRIKDLWERRGESGT
jgi:phosphopantothenoylcysteine decarboxylase/phosphopantothenate--cysteine ligase